MIFEEAVAVLTKADSEEPGSWSDELWEQVADAEEVVVGSTEVTQGWLDGYTFTGTETKESLNTMYTRWVTPEV